MDDTALMYLATQHAAAMTTLRRDGTPHTVRVGVAPVDGKIWSSGTRGRARTAHLRRDPRSTLFVFDGAWRWLTMECRVTILDGAEVPELSARLFHVMQGGDTAMPPDKITWYGQDRTIDEFLKLMVAEERLIYEFEVLRSYGMYGEVPAR